MVSQHPVSQRRKGFTIVELLVGVAIVAALTAVTLPAIQASRESARLTSCRNNVAQLSKAMIQFEGYYGYFPSGGWSSQWLGVADRPGDSAQPGGWAYGVLPYMEEMATRNIVANVSAGQTATAYNKLVTTPMPGFACPTRRVAQPIATTSTSFLTASGPVSITKATRTDYAMNSGSKGSCPDLSDFATVITAAGKGSGKSNKVTICHAPPGNPTKGNSISIAISGLNGHINHDGDRLGSCSSCTQPVFVSTPGSVSIGDVWRKMSAAQKLAGSNGITDLGIPDIQDGLVSRMSRLKSASVADGLSNTYLIGEKYVSSNTYYSGTDSGDGGAMMAGYSSDTARWGYTPPAMDTKASNPAAFGSGHRAGWNMAYADGMVRTISFSIDPTLHANLSGRNDGPGVIAIPPK
jgi:prepilin-type N-terminal cleavage/methylation domain-containing protein